jgi:hypothetical protein
MKGKADIKRKNRVVRLVQQYPDANEAADGESDAAHVILWCILLINNRHHRLRSSHLLPVHGWEPSPFFEFETHLSIPHEHTSPIDLPERQTPGITKDHDSDFALFGAFSAGQRFFGACCSELKQKKSKGAFACDVLAASTKKARKARKAFRAIPCPRSHPPTLRSGTGCKNSVCHV